MTFRLLTASLLQVIRSTDCTVSFISQRSAVIGAFRSFYCSIVPASSCSLSGPLLYRSPVVVFLDRGYPCFRNFNSTIPVDVIRVKSYVNSFLDPTSYKTTLITSTGIVEFKFLKHGCPGSGGRSRSTRCLHSCRKDITCDRNSEHWSRRHWRQRALQTFLVRQGGMMAKKNANGRKQTQKDNTTALLT